MNYRFFFYSFVILELFLQIIFLADVKSFKKPILFFNPYCDQSYWNHVEKSSFNKKIFEYHPILTFIKKNNASAFNLENENLISPNKNDLIFYGSSFIDHKYFKPYYKDMTNYAVKSYGLDQIFTSYELTKNHHYDDIIIFGFLLEDLDRALFNKRNFQKMKFLKTNGTYQMNYTPIDLNNQEKNEITFYLYRFIKNIVFLSLNNFDYKKSICKIDKKKELFIFFISNIIENSKILNQKLIFITFNFQEDIDNNNWRYSFIKDYLKLNNVKLLDVKEIIKKDMNQKKLKSKDYFSKEDLHLNKLGFEVVVNKLDSLIKQYR